MISLWIEAAFRSILVAAVVWAGLKALRVRNVVAQKGVWGLVLAAALLMPLLAPLTARLQLLPVEATVALPFPVLISQLTPTPAAQVAERLQTALPAAAYDRGARDLEAEDSIAKLPGGSRNARRGASKPLPVTSKPFPATLQASPESPMGSPALVRSSVDSAARVLQPAPRRWRVEPAGLALGLYLAIAGILLLRLVFGFATAMGLWLRAHPVSEDVASRFPAGLALRCSAAVSAPVTIGSGVLLPADYAGWNAEKLRIVVAHESSHVRQGDFYLQLLAGLYAALVWISPLGWWLKRKLSDLSEAISDRAGLEQAASPSLYARILLEFAALPRPTPAGVAMARTSNLSHRIERLLNESSFRQAFAGGRRRGLVAVLLVPASLFVATTFIRVEAAAKPAAALSIQTSGVSNPEQADSIPVNQAATPAPAADSASPAPEAAVVPVPAPAAVPVPPIPPAPADLVNPVSADDIRVLVDKAIKINQDIHVRADIHPDVHVDQKAINDAVNLADMAQGLAASDLAGHGRVNGYHYSFSDNGDSYAVINGKGEHLNFSGNWNDDVQKQIEKASQQAHGKFLWFTRDGKSYILDDPAIVDQIQQMYMPMEALGRAQEQFAREQEQFAKQQAERGKEMAKDSIPTPDLAKEMAELNAAVAKLEASKAKTMTTEQWADLESKIGNLQGKIGSIEGSIGALQGLSGEKMGKLGELQGKLGAEQGKLGEKQGKLAMEADRKIKAIIDEALRDGKAKPVQ
jgi:hypothetical protein